MNQTIIRHLSKLLSFSIILMLLNGCGFQLRGNYLLAPELQTIAFSSVDQYGELTRLVKQHLTINDVNLVQNSAKEIPQMRMLQDNLDRRTLSVFPNGQVAEYELIYTVRYQILIPGQDVQNFSF